MNPPDTLLAAAIDALSTIVVILDANGTIIAANRAWMRLGGADYGPGANFFDSLARAGANGALETAQIVPALRDVLDGKEPFRHLEVPCALGKELRWYSTHIVRFNNGAALGVAVTFEDVTHWVQDRDSNSESHHLAQTMRDIATALTSTLDPDAVMERILQHVGRLLPYDAANILMIEGSQAFLIYRRGYSPDVEALFSQCALPLDTPSLSRMLATGRSVVVPDTSEEPGWVQIMDTRWVRSYIGAPLRAQGKVIGFINLDSATPKRYAAQHAELLQIFADQASLAVENARLYAALLQYTSALEQRVEQRTAELNHALEKEKELSRQQMRFNSMISHEFRAPLAVVLTAASLVKDFGARLTPAQRDEQLEKIRSEVRRLTGLVDNILDYSRTELGWVQFEPDYLHPEKLCESVVADFESMIGHTHHIVFAREGICQAVLVDEELLRQILENLLSNSVKYSQPGSTVHLSLSCQINQLVFEIRDQGIGIPADELPHIFEAFYRARNARDIKGTGLGLAIVKHGVDQHGGTITVQSVVGQGTTFTVTIPTTPA